MLERILIVEDEAHIAAGLKLNLEAEGFQTYHVADGLSAPFADPTSQRLIERYVDDVVLVTDDEIIAALRLILERTKQLVEPAGAAAVSAFMTGKAGAAAGARAVATLSGGNVDFEKLKRIL